MKIWRKKEKDRQDWLDQNEKPMRHKKAQQEMKQEDGDEEEKDGGTPGVKDVKVDQEEEKKAPEIRCNSEQVSSSDKKAEGSTRSTSEKRRRHVMIDFHNTIDIGNAIPPANHAAVEKLLLAKHPVTICSWCFQKRKQEVIDTLVWGAGGCFLHPAKDWAWWQGQNMP